MLGALGVVRLDRGLVDADVLGGDDVPDLRRGELEVGKHEGDE